MKRIIYYTDNSIDNTRIANVCRKYLRRSGLPITSVTHKPMEFGHNIVYQGKPSARAILEQILLGLRSCSEDTIFLCEHDCLYHRSYFKLDSSSITFNLNVYRLTSRGYYKKDKSQWMLSQMLGKRDEVIRAIEQKLTQPDPIMLLEPGRGDNWPVDFCRAKIPTIDIRNGQNFSHWRPRGKCQSKIPYWGHYARNLTNLA